MPGIQAALPASLGRSTGATVRRRRATVVAAAVVVGCFTFSYRFNTLGGALAGFDNDHFVHLAYAKQVEAGEQPFRDFLDWGLQGARPSLTYEASAWAQRILGDNLRSEALLTVGALATAAAVTVAVSASAAPLAASIFTTLLTVLLAPKLYCYPKVLLFALTLPMLFRYAARPTGARVMALAILGAMAFLFRHDYAAYITVGVLTVIPASMSHWGSWRRTGAHLLGFGATTAVLLGPSLLLIQRDVGLQRYFAASLAISAREAQRTRANPPWFSGPFSLSDPVRFFVREENATAWLYYAAWIVPVLVLLMLWRERRRTPPAVARALAATAAMTLAMDPFVLRGNFGARLGDVGPPLALLGAALLGWAVVPVRRIRPLRVIFGVVPAALILWATATSVWAVASVGQELDTAGWSDSVGKLTRQTTRLWTTLGGLPAAGRPRPGDSFDGVDPSDDIAAYLRTCTASTDRVLILSFAPELLVLSDRLFAGGRAVLVKGFYADEGFDLFTVSRLANQSVPIALADDEPPEGFPHLLQYVSQQYRAVGRLRSHDRSLRVLVHRNAVPTGTFGPERLPCFSPLPSLDAGGLDAPVSQSEGTR